MRRPPGLWILLSAGVVWLSLQDVYGLRATSLIFGKTTTTTTTTTEEPAPLEEETATTELSGDPNATKPTLTGNPQLDYIWDPNLPKELNGFNLSDYPFYERVPEDIDFKCDGLHDGFYASVQHKCQVYHHCLFGTRYDFLCANYTAFDQKTFICHFASEVDCANSKKFWHRNDALYKSASTTTVKPFVIHTPPPQPQPITVPAIAPLNPSGPDLRRPVGSRRRPFRRRRPQLDYYEDDYYDDYYEDRPRSNRGRKRPRPRPRPLYDDEYDDEYDEDRYERRGGSRREEKRRPYDRRPSRKRNNERVKYDYDDEVDDRFEDEDFKLNNRRKSNRKKTVDEEYDDRHPERRKQGKRRPSNNKSEENNQKPTRKVQRRPPLDDYEDDKYQVDDSRELYDRRRKNEGRTSKPKEETRTVIKPVSGTIYDRPRLAPRIKLPVPKNEADKYAYKPVVTEATAQEDEEYYEEYEEEPVLEKKTTPKIPAVHSRNSRPKNVKESKSSNSRKQIPSESQSHPRRPADSYERPESIEDKETRDVPIAEEYYDDYEEQEEESKSSLHENPVSKNGKREKSSSLTSTTTSTTSTTTTTQRPIEKIQQPIVRLVKRPFLPSRGGNPYVARGLQPVGFKAVEKMPDISVKKEQDNQDGIIDDQTHSKEDEMKYEKYPYLPSDAIKSSTDEVKPAFKPSPVIIKMPPRVQINTEDFHPQQNAHQNYNQKDFAGPRTTQKPKLPERNPLDINEDDYDVTLNDALNPTLPNLPVRGSPVGFSSENDYTQRHRYESDAGLSAEGSDYVYQVKPYRQVYIPQSNARDHFVNSNAEFSGQYSTLRENYRPRQVQQETEAFYSRY